MTASSDTSMDMSIPTRHATLDELALPIEDDCNISATSGSTNNPPQSAKDSRRKAKTKRTPIPLSEQKTRSQAKEPSWSLYLEEHKQKTTRQIQQKPVLYTTPLKPNSTSSAIGVLYSPPLKQSHPPTTSPFQTT
jgi:hypothetical protein